MKAKNAVVGTRVEIKRDDCCGTRAGDTGTIVEVGVNMITIRLDVERLGWKDEELNIPDGHGVYLYSSDVRKLKES